MAELGLGHRRLKHRVVEPVELEREEQQLGGNRGDLLLDVAEEFLPLGVRGVSRVKQAGIGDDAAEHVVQHLELAHRLREMRAALAAVEQRGKLAGVPLLHGVGRPLGGFKVGLELRRLRSLIKIGEVPFRQFAELYLAPCLGGLGRLRLALG